MSDIPLPPLVPALKHARNALYDMLPIVGGECAYALDAQYSASPRLIYTAILGALSAAIGPLYRFKPPDWHSRPISSWTMLSFETGSAKTPIYQVLAQPFQEVAAEQRAKHAAASDDYRQEVERWRFQKSLLQKKLSRKSTSNYDKALLQVELEALAAREPKPPKERPLIINNFDHESFMSTLEGFEEAVAIIPNEGDGLLLGRWLSNNASVLNDIHDGLDPPQYRRDKKPPITAESAFVSMNLFTRPGTTQRFRQTYKNGQALKSKLVDLGFLARFRVAVDDGVRSPPLLYRPADPEASILALQALVKGNLVRKQSLMEAGWAGRTLLELEPRAIPTWQRIVHQVKVARDTEWADNEFAGKILVHTGSLAAAIHVAESDSRLVSLSAIERGWEFAREYAIQYVEAFAPPPPPSLLKTDADLVENYLRGNYVLIDYRRVDLAHMAYMLRIPLQRIKAVAHHLVHYGLAFFCPGTRGAEIDVTPMMAPTRFITRR